MSTTELQTLTYRGAQLAYEPPREPLRKFGNPKVVCEGWYAVGRSAAFKPGTIKQRAAVAIVDVFLDELVTGTSDLLAKLRKLALDGPFFLLSVCAHPRIQRTLYHIS